MIFFKVTLVNGIVSERFLARLYLALLLLADGGNMFRLIHMALKVVVVGILETTLVTIKFN